ncbi:MAG: helix-turn-helix transcriptional regulator [Ferruginibacter sp.]
MKEKEEIIEIKIAEIDLYLIDKARKLRVDKGISQVSLSIAMGLAEGTVGRIENPRERAKYNIRHINLLAKALKCNPSDLLPTKPLKNDIIKARIKIIRNKRDKKGEPNYQILEKTSVKDL